MARQSFIHNPLGRVQMQLAGGPRGVLFLAALYAGVVLLFLTTIYRIASTEVSTTRFAAVSMYVFLFIELAILLLGGTTAISKAVQRDFTSDMITSHRMSAMSGHSAVFGYLTGAPAHVFALSIVNWIICTILSKLADPVTPGAMIVPSFLFALFGCTAWMVFTLAVLLAVCTRGSQFTAGLVVVIVLLTNAKAMTLVPGIAILLASATYSDLTGASSAGQMIDPWIIVSVMAQLALGLIFFLAAARRMHRDDYSAFNPTLAYILLAFSALLGTVGLSNWQPPASFIPIPGRNNDELKSVATIVILCLIALIVVSNSARNHVDWVRRRRKDPAFQKRSPLNFFAGALLATGMVVAIWSLAAGKWFWAFLEELQDEVEGGMGPAERIGAIVAAALLALLVAGCVFRVHRRRSSRMPSTGLAIGMFLPLIAYFAVYWILPIAADLALEEFSTRLEGRSGRTLLFAASPVGTWIVACSNTIAPIWSGLGIQAGVLALMMIITRGRAIRAVPAVPTAT